MTHRNLIATPHSVQNRLTRDLIFLVLILITLFIIFSYSYVKQIQNNITQAIINSSEKMVIDKNHRIFDPISNNLTLSRKWAELEALTPEKQQIFNKRFIPILETLPQISSVIIASSNGSDYYFSRQGDNWVSRYTPANEKKSNNTMAQWQLWSSNNKSLKKWQQSTDYRAIDRPWHALGLSTDSKTPIKWTAPYLFYTQQTPGITGVTSWKNSNNEQFILAFDVTLTDIAKTLSDIHISDMDIAYLITPEGKVILPPQENSPQLAGSASHGLLYTPSKNDNNYIIFDAVNDWLAKESQPNHITSFSRNGKLWWYKVFSLGTYHNSIYASIIVPEKELLDIISDNIMFILIGIAVLLGLAFAMSYFLVKKYAHQLKDVPKTSILAQDFNNEIYHLLRQGESETLEFKSTMRKNLKTGKNGKEIEIAWLKGLVGFMNTHGGILLIGVDDDANILGLDNDEFDNEDKILLHFKNLLSQHIGLEFSNNINLIINQIDGKTILVIECERSNRPVFLYHKNNEEFYIRSGPASVKLSVSKVLNYVAQRY